jgi:hypothetical protein
MSNVKYLETGADMPSKSAPNPELIEMLTQALKMAESGQLQSYIGTGFAGDGLRLSTWGNFHDDKYQMLGSLNWLAHEYVHLTTGENT